MDSALASLIAASVAFVGGHFVMSHPLRAPLVRALGEKGFLGLYSVISLATFAWMAWAFSRTEPYALGAWTGNDEVSWTLASVLTLVALVLLIGSLAGNPALPGVPAETAAKAEAHGVYRVTRHPMMWAFALWSIAHIAIAPTDRTLVLAGAILILALVGAHLQDRKKTEAHGEAWVAWSGKTSYWPKWSRIFSVGWGLWLGAVVLWLVLTWMHVWLAYIPAGIWRWF
jgi:uncharacterized membrane protein